MCMRLIEINFYFFKNKRPRTTKKLEANLVSLNIIISKPPFFLFSKTIY